MEEHVVPGIARSRRAEGALLGGDRLLQVEQGVKLVVGLLVGREHRHQARVHALRRLPEGPLAVAAQARHAAGTLLHEALVIAPLVRVARVHHAPYGLCQPEECLVRGVVKI